MRANGRDRYSVYLLYWYKSTSTDAERELFAAKKKKAAVRIAVEMFKQGAMTKDDAICKVSECLFKSMC